MGTITPDTKHHYTLVLEFREVVAEAFEGGAGEGGGAEEAAELAVGHGLPVDAAEGGVGGQGGY